MSSATLQGQFRVAPVVLLIDDAKGLYNFSIFLLDKLHSSLPEEMLDGHRDRFSQSFAKLRKFYGSLKPYGYFTELLTIPTLPTFEPLFKSSVVAADLQQEETHVSTAPPPEPDFFVTDLIDINADIPPTAAPIQVEAWGIPPTPLDNALKTEEVWEDAGEPGPSGALSSTNGEDVWQLLKQKDALIKQLQDDIVNQQIEHNNEILQMQKELMGLRNHLRNG